MVQITCNKARAEARGREPLTVGMSNAVTVGFDFSPEWAGLSKTAVFTNGKITVDVLESQWTDGVAVDIPHEVLAEEGRRVQVGIYGTDGERVVLPTVWATLGVVLPAAEPSGDASTDPTLPVWAQLRKEIEDIEVSPGDIEKAVRDYLDENPVEAPQADWSTNDKTDPAYVKNRTHWEEFETVYEGTGVWVSQYDLYETLGYGWMDLPRDEELSLYVDGEFAGTGHVNRGEAPNPSSITFQLPGSTQTEWKARTWVNKKTAWEHSGETIVGDGHTPNFRITRTLAVHRLEDKYLPEAAMPFVVTFSGGTGWLYSDKSFAEIKAAVDAGRVVMGKRINVTHTGKECISLNFVGFFNEAALFYFLDFDSNELVVLTLNDDGKASESRISLSPVKSVNGSAGDVKTTVTVTSAVQEDGTIKASHTADEIKALVDAGYAVNLEYNGVLIPLIRCEADGAGFLVTSAENESAGDLLGLSISSIFCYIDKAGRISAESEIFSAPIASRMVVHVAENAAGNLSCDKTYEEVEAAITCGNSVVLKLNSKKRESRTYSFSCAGDGYLSFTAAMEIYDHDDGVPEGIYSPGGVLLYNNNTIHIDAEDDLPFSDMTAKNPHALTFTGAAEASYDGSAAVSVEIPAAGNDLGITGAEVGQTVKITAVDEAGKPTAWEAVEMAGGGGGYVDTVIADITIAEEVQLYDTPPLSADQREALLSADQISVYAVLKPPESAASRGSLLIAVYGSYYNATTFFEADAQRNGAAPSSAGQADNPVTVLSVRSLGATGAYTRTQTWCTNDNLYPTTAFFCSNVSVAVPNGSVVRLRASTAIGAGSTCKIVARRFLP